MTTNDPYGTPQDDTPEGADQGATQDPNAAAAPDYGQQPQEPDAYGSQPQPDYGAQPGYGQQPDAYGAQPQPGYGQQPDAYGAQPDYGAQPQQAAYPAQQPAYPAQQPAYGGGIAPSGVRFKQGQAIAVLIIGLFGGLVGWAGTVLAIIALVKGNEDPQQGNKFVKIGWVLAIVGVVLMIIATILYIVAVVAAVQQGVPAGY